MANFLFIEGLEIDFYNPRSIIVFVGILQGVVFATLLFKRARENKNFADFWLASLLIFLCSSLITPLIGFANIYDRNQWLTYFPFGISYTYGVCVWFYVVHLTDSKRKFTRKDLLLFIPTFIFLVFRFILFAQNLEFKYWFNKNYYNPIAAPIIFVTEFGWNILFLYLCLKHYKKYRAWLNENFSDTEKIKFDWLRNFLYLFTFIFILSGIFGFTDNFIGGLSYIQYFYFEFILVLVTYYLAIAGYLRSQSIELNFAPISNEIETIETEERKTLLSEKELEKLKTKLQNLMQNEKPYLEPTLTLTDLSKQLGVNSAVLSYAINTGFGKNFNDFINEFRIQEVKEKLQNADDSTLLGIAFDCGFNSKATFNRAFKKSTDVSPKEFQENLIDIIGNKNLPANHANRHE